MKIIICNKNMGCYICAPPGFENSQAEITHKEVQSGPSTQEHQGIVTRSQKGAQQGSAASPSGTPESLVKLANESLDVAKLLGVRITRNKQCVVRDSLGH